MLPRAATLFLPHRGTSLRLSERARSSDDEDVGIEQDKQGDEAAHEQTEGDLHERLPPSGSEFVQPGPKSIDNSIDNSLIAFAPAGARSLFHSSRRLALRRAYELSRFRQSP